MIEAAEMRRASAVVIMAAAAVAVAQQKQPEPAAKGLDALDDDVLISELANRQLTPLLDRYFEQRQMPEEQRKAIRATLDGLRALNSATPLPNKERAAAVAAINANVDAVIGTIRDPRFFLQLATVLIRTSVERDSNTLEYWGPSAPLQLSLRPTVETVLEALDKAKAEGEKERDRVAAVIQPGNQDQLAPRYTKYDNYATTAEFTRHMSEYYLALTYDPAAPERRKLAQEAITYLEQFDNSESQVQATVKLRLGKLHMIEGDMPPARTYFKALAAAKDEEIKPAPDLSQQFEARFFAAVTDLLDNRLDEATAGLASLREWVGGKIPASNTAARNGATAAATILDYRILMARGEAQGPADRRPFYEQARGLLNKLVADRPDLRPIVYAQVLATLPEQVAIDQIDPVVLAALVREGDLERLKPADEKANVAVLERALAAARELVKRKGQPGVSDDVADTAFAVEGFLLDRLDRKVEAATALLDYVASKPANRDNAAMALDAALGIIDHLRKVNRYDESTAALYRRALPMAIEEPFNRKDLAFDFARWLQRQGAYGDAASYYRKVPKDDRRIVTARFYEMLATKQQLDADKGTLPAALRGEMTADVRRLADDVAAMAPAAAKAAPDIDQRVAYQALVPKSVLVVADSALRHEHNPRRTIQVLAGFGTKYADVPGQSDRLADALLLRVSAYMDLGQSAEATAELVKLLSHQSGGQGANVIYTLLKKLDADLDSAKRAGDADRMRALARSRAALSGYLVDWAAKNSNPDIRKYTYRYRVFDAATHQMAAELESDPSVRKTALGAALKRYQALLSPDNHKEYAETLGPEGDKSAPDPTVLLGVAACQFDLGDFAAAQPVLAELLNGRRLGPAQLPGADGPTDNDAYWQATYQLLKSNAELARGKPAEAMEPTKAHLKRLFVEFGRGVGGPKWAPRFEALRKELVPDFQVPDVAGDGA